MFIDNRRMIVPESGEFEVYAFQQALMQTIVIVDMVLGYHIGTWGDIHAISPLQILPCEPADCVKVATKWCCRLAFQSY